MTDYGHDLLFGTFLTPRADDPPAVVRLAQSTETAGLDLVTFQDHPYQAAFLDIWTLLSYVAAVTERVRIAPNVLDLPLRPPAVVARTAASLDRLSGGRLELGLGPGAFWDAIEAMGGRRLEPGQTVAALEEAITVIRALWATDQEGGVFHDGTHHPMRGAKRGPAPVHDIGIWVGALKPQVLDLVGRVADGWLPSMSYLGSVEALAEGNARIDAAAAAAGRDPRSVRRLLTIGSGEAEVETLLGLTRDHGVTGFILATDDERQILRFGREVSPAVRELVAAQRGTTHEPPVKAPVKAPVGTPAAASYGDRPTGPPPPDGVVLTERGRAISKHLVKVHDHLRAELDQLRSLVDQVLSGQLRAGDARSAINEMTMRQNDWVLGAYCANYCHTVTVHHSIEDASMLPHLRSMDPGLAPVIDRLQAEHVDIHHVLQEVDRRLVSHVAAPDGNAADLRGAVDRLGDILLSHLSYEERELEVPLARFGMAPGQL